MRLSSFVLFLSLFFGNAYSQKIIFTNISGGLSTFSSGKLLFHDTHVESKFDQSISSRFSCLKVGAGMRFRKKHFILECSVGMSLFEQEFHRNLNQTGSIHYSYHLVTDQNELVIAPFEELRVGFMGQPLNNLNVTFTIGGGFAIPIIYKVLSGFQYERIYNDQWLYPVQNSYYYDELGYKNYNATYQSFVDIKLGIEYSPVRRMSVALEGRINAVPLSVYTNLSLRYELFKSSTNEP